MTTADPVSMANSMHLSLGGKPHPVGSVGYAFDCEPHQIDFPDDRCDSYA
jgi:hypothetical protein